MNGKTTSCNIGKLKNQTINCGTARNPKRYLHYDLQDFVLIITD